MGDCHFVSASKHGDSKRIRKKKKKAWLRNSRKTWDYSLNLSLISQGTQSKSPDPQCPQPSIREEGEEEEGL